MKKKWKVSKPEKSLASGELMYGVDGPDVISDYENWGFTKESAQLISCAPELLGALIATRKALEIATTPVSKDRQEMLAAMKLADLVISKTKVGK